MAIVANHAQIGVQQIGSSVTIPDNPTAKLMFYLECMCDVLDLDDPNLGRLTNYENYWRLTNEEEGQLIILCYLLSPDVLNDKCIFHDEAACGDSVNQFYEVSAVQNRLLVTENILIGNQQRHVKKIMFYKASFIQNYYIIPMIVLKTRLETLLAAQQQSGRAITYTTTRRKKRCAERHALNCFLCIIFPPWCLVWFCLCLCEDDE